ncbi:hypothetical protein RN001_014072 [Aquatica leii]|uniref:Uncharacterized protein n=1 Tax=Aquatica leii TaxID=1421715 RepID=A0AAN7SCP4_9COLE|nr:hypothetical protein RN001_014072 [Aquatica leii]
MSNFFLNHIRIPWIVFILLTDIKVQSNQDMVEQGRAQYQLLQERKNLPTYGNCWKSAIEHIETSCRSLSEDTQSTVALHLANCFLEMSGHESYNCELEKKLNLKQICISSMSDRAFNVYTEFYTHTQNICWFLQGQIWQESIAENTFEVIKQLEQSVKQQEDILKIQKESLDVQEKLLKHGRDLENVMETLYSSIWVHQEMLSAMSSSLKSLQSWLIGEFSWIDLIVFYISTSILILLLTSSKQTANARLPLWILLISNGVVERFICTYIVNSYSGDDLYSTLSMYIWWTRNSFYILALITLIYFAYCYEDLNIINNGLLQKVYNQNLSILNKFDEFKDKRLENVQTNISFLQERVSRSPVLETIHKNLVKENGDNRKHLEKSFTYNLRSKSRSPWDKYC